MDCDVGLLSSEIDVPKHHSDLKNIFAIYPPSLDGVLESDNMGLENTWTDDEFVVPPIPDLPPIPLPAPSNNVDVTFEDTTTSSAPILEEIDCLFSPVSQANDAQEDSILDGGVGTAEPGVCGLRNLGNTCFMGAGIQCLMATAPIAIALYKTPSTPNHPLTNSLADLTRKIWCGRYTTFQPMQFKMALASHFPQFNDFRQHDCQEFLALLLDGLHEQLNTATSKDIACQVETEELPEKRNVKVSTSQSTSQDIMIDCDPKCDGKELHLFKDTTRDKKSNLEKGTNANFCSPEPYVPLPVTSHIEKCDNLNCDKQLNNKQGILLNRDMISVVNNTAPHITGIEDILKEAKTSNLNVLVTREEANNELRMECERKGSTKEDITDDITSSLLSPNLADITYDKTSEVEADSHWQKHLAENKSVVVNTFQGQFKSTVVCSVCKFISVTYEPFMYLSVPLPNAMQKKLKVTFIGESLKHPTEFLLELNKYDNVNYLRDQILIKVGCEVKGPIVIAEVFDHHIAKVLEDHQLIRYLNDSDRSLYAFEVTTLLDKTALEPIDDSKVEEYLVDTCCIICLEDKDSNMKQHADCTCILCESCIAASCTHYGGSTFDCPVCRKEINPDEHLKNMKPQSNMTARMINIPLVFRVDTVGDGNNNQKNVELFGHPMLVRIPNHCTSEALKEAIASLLPYKEPYRLLLVDGQGLHCSRCMYHSHCRGCELPDDVSLYTSDTIAVTFTAPVKVLPTTSSLASLSAQASSLTLYDCIQAFSQSETLDGNNPWFCPQCKQSRCATKTLSVWRYPDYLIVYLKRFVFHNHISTKLEEKVLFPLTGLSLATGSDYDLYACVCHIGGVSAGHYTTYAQHPYTHQWHYFNDSFVSKQSPLEEDYSNAYILFYKKQGLQPPPIDGGNGIFSEL
ncbi:unnamed protein product [Nezara viridula]|uniref:ubiquitinyl hydrolase 1 n=1 Tax=Nezara viridula TaxID=85310 RepID=A0A9P0HRI5_NEZVI|nr:unnamed protein product [Nezara viridula]